ncbi:polymorphic toxin-type HINT domain-containing protein [Streptomyces sp. NPDC006267]|uniref:polymorphic toxin-type HINT domain-containing protein n=1 Tax=Streptomyces sp. NPDC006267 TaxID=3157173 RepID=UPI0033A909F1
MLQLRALTARQRLPLFSGVGVVALALIAGLLALSGNGSEVDGQQAAAQRNLKPFKEAADALADAPGLRYEDTSAHSITENDITVTSGGSQFGTTGHPGRAAKTDRGVLRIGGKTFIRWQNDPSPGPEHNRGSGSEGQPDPAQPSEWMVGMEDGSTLLDEALARTTEPAKLASDLSTALAALEKAPSSPYDPQQRKKNVNGKPALGMDTSAGRLWVTKDKPHRVLRLEPYDLRQNISDMKERMERGETPRAAPRVTTGPLASRDSEGFDLTPILGQAAQQMFDTLVEYAGQLKDATDHGINFTLSGSGDLDCSSKGCRATERFTGQISSKARQERVTSGKVTAVMSATFTIDGKPAGRCTSTPRTFTAQGASVSGSLTCSTPAAGPIYTSTNAQYKAKAQAESRARNGATVRYNIPFRANTLIDAQALASVEAEKLLAQAKRERTNCASNSFLPGTPVLMADGSRPPIEDVRPGDTVLATDPETGDTRPEPVTNLITGDGEKHLVTITVDTDGNTGNHTADITATNNHPFWTTKPARWTNATDLAPGDWLRTSAGTYVQITAIDRRTAPNTTVYNLTVNNLHTYYVLAGATAVLVHNCNEVFHRVMSEKEFNQLGTNGEITVRGTENFVTQNREYLEGLRRQTHRRGGRNADKYTVLVRFEMSPGTRDALIAAGKRPGEIGQDVNAVHLKSERGFDTYGLRPGSVGVFNSRIVGFGRVEDW